MYKRQVVDGAVVADHGGLAEHDAHAVVDEQAPACLLYTSPKLIKGELDMAAIPANLAATLYQKTNGGIQVMAVNTLGVLYVVCLLYTSTSMPRS